MNITLNSQQYDVPEKATLQSLVAAQLGDKQNGIAVAVNNVVISKIARETYVLQPNDTVLIIKATQGG